jgi:hypothetical protein
LVGKLSRCTLVVLLNFGETDFKELKGLCPEALMCITNLITMFGRGEGQGFVQILKI